MSGVVPLAVIPVGVLVERSTSAGPWSDFLWRPIGVLTGAPDTPAWTKLSVDGDRTTFYAGAADVELHRAETANYRNNLLSGTPLLWVVLRRTDADLPYELAVVTADPAESEAMAAIGDGIVESVAMPDSIQDAVAAFVSEHHVERAFVKRERDRPDLNALARRAPPRDDETQ
ncbi:MAG TPA: DUF3305 domain-containing protein [Pseudolabrys sp.]